MLVLSRKPNEEIVIGGNIIVKVIEVKGNRVRLGITAPDSIPVHRREVLNLSSDADSPEEHSEVTLTV